MVIKNNSKKSSKVLMITLGLMVFFVIQDLLGFFMWSKTGGYSGESYLAAGNLYSLQFWLFAYVSILAVSGTYYLLTKDWSESLALITTPVILLWFGVHDLLYWLSGLVKWSLADGVYLYEHMPVIRIMADIVGSGIVSIKIFILSSLLGLLIAYKVYVYLVNKY